MNSALPRRLMFQRSRTTEIEKHPRGRDGVHESRWCRPGTGWADRGHERRIPPRRLVVEVLRSRGDGPGRGRSGSAQRSTPPRAPHLSGVGRGMAHTLGRVRRLDQPRAQVRRVRHTHRHGRHGVEPDDDHSRARISSKRCPRYAIRRGGDIYIYGSLSVARALLTAGMVDELLLMIEPITLGGGKTLFPADGEAREFALVSAQTAATGVQVCRYPTRRLNLRGVGWRVRRRRPTARSCRQAVRKGAGGLVGGDDVPFGGVEYRRDARRGDRRFGGWAVSVRGAVRGCVSAPACPTCGGAPRSRACRPAQPSPKCSA